MSSTPKTIYIIRHGETTSNRKAVIQGSDEPLTDIGQKQAKKLGLRLKRDHVAYPIQCLLTSAYTRAVQTAEIIGACIEKTPHHYENAHERKHPSVIVGKSFSDAAIARIVNEGRKNFHDPSFVYGDGENFIQLKLRALATLEYMLTLQEEHIALVTHGMFATALAAASQRGKALTSQDIEHYQFRLSNTGLCTLVYRDRKTFSKDDTGWLILKWNDIAHLERHPELMEEWYRK